MSYANASDVAILTPHLIPGASTFSTSTSPTLAAVNAWLSAGCALIEGKLATKGYDAVPFSSPIISFIVDLNATYGAWRAERSLISSRTTKAENTRADMFKKEFNEGVTELLTMDLTNMGVSRGKKAPANYAGGISQSDKAITEADDDRIEPRFSRDQYRNPYTKKPNTERSSEQNRRDP